MPQTIPIDNLNALAWELRSSDPVRAGLLAAEARSLSIGGGETYRRGLAEALRTMALSAFAGGDYRQALATATEALELLRELGDRRGEFITLQTIGQSYYRLGEYRASLECFHQTIQTARELGERRFEAITLNNIGLVEGSLGDLAASLESHMNSLQVVESLGDRTLEAMITINIGVLHSRLGEPRQAIAQYERGIAICREVGDRVSIAKALNNIGICHEKLGDYERALDFHLQSIALWEELGQKEHVTGIYHNIGTIYLDMGDPERALEYTLKSREDQSAVDMPGREFAGVLQLGRIALAMNRPDEAIAYLDEALGCARRSENLAEQSEAQRLLSDAWLQAGDAARAIEHLKEHQRLRDDLFNRQTEERLHTLRIAREVAVAQKEAEIERLRNVELRKAFDDLKAAQAQIVQSEKMASLGQLTAGIAHEINNPVNFVTGSVAPARRNIDQMHRLVEATLVEIPFERAEELRAEYELDEIVSELAALMDAIARGAERTAQIVSSLRQFSRFEEGDRKRVDLHEGLDVTIDLLGGRFPERTALIRAYGEIPMVDCYPGEINQVFMNILSNALQAIPEGGRITITTSASEGNVQVAISDTGIGMTPEVQARIFEPFYTTREVGEGRGLGLSIAWGIVEKHGGTITVSSTPGAGSEFVVTLPVDGGGKEFRI
jgi:two-component system, NtrC family, sensor kinase